MLYEHGLTKAFDRAKQKAAAQAADPHFRGHPRSPSPRTNEVGQLRPIGQARAASVSPKGARPNGKARGGSAKEKGLLLLLKLLDKVRLLWWSRLELLPLLPPHCSLPMAP